MLKVGLAMEISDQKQAHTERCVCTQAHVTFWEKRYFLVEKCKPLMYKKSNVLDMKFEHYSWKTGIK